MRLAPKPKWDCSPILRSRFQIFSSSTLEWLPPSIHPLSDGEPSDTRMIDGILQTSTLTSDPWRRFFNAFGQQWRTLRWMALAMLRRIQATMANIEMNSLGNAQTHSSNNGDCWDGWPWQLLDAFEQQWRASRWIAYCPLMSHKKRSAACLLSISFLPHIRQTYQIFHHARTTNSLVCSRRRRHVWSSGSNSELLLFAALAFRWLTDV